MTYVTFIAIFLGIPIVLLIAVNRAPLGGYGTRIALPPLFLIMLIAVVYTAPWDNYLIYRDVWSYGADRVAATVFLVPVEEYAFMALQCLLTGLVLFLFLGRRRRHPRTIRETTVTIGLIGYGLLTAAGAYLLISGIDRGFYLGLILAWAGPVLMGTWYLGARRFILVRFSYFAAIILPSVYLWLADMYAIRNGIWEISSEYTLGVEVAGLPLEEATFFLLTNVLVVQGTLLFLPGDSKV